MTRAFNLTLFIAIAGLPAASNLLLTFALIRALGISGFAAWSIIEPLLLIFSVVGTLGTHFAVLYFAARQELDPRRVLGAALMLSILPALVTAMCVGIAVHQADPRVSPVALLLPMLADALAQQITAMMRGQKKLGLWTGFEVVRSLGMVVAAYGALRWWGWWVSDINRFLLLRGMLTGSAVIAASIGLRARPNLDLQLMTRLVRYGLPVSGASILGLVINSADRFLLGALGMSAETIASYAAHQRLTGFLGVLTVSPLQLWYPVQALQRDPETESLFFQGVLAAVTGSLVLLSVGAFIGGPMLWPIMFAQLTFNPVLFAILGISIIPRALAITFNIGGLREKHTHLNTVATGITSVVMIVLSVPFILIGGAIGAAVARLLSQTIQAGGIGRTSQRVAPVAYSFRRLSPFLCACVTVLVVPIRLGSALSLSALATTLILVGLGVMLNRSSLSYLVQGRTRS